MSELKSYDLVDIQDYRGEVYLKSEVDAILADKNQRIKELTPQWVRLSDRLPTTYGPHLVIFQNGKCGCLPFNVEAKSFQVAGAIQLWADAKYIFGAWTRRKDVNGNDAFGPTAYYLAKEIYSGQNGLKSGASVGWNLQRDSRRNNNGD